jgi:hypothetical protein
VKCRAFKLLLFLLAGAIINVAVAWGCALTIDVDVGRMRQAFKTEGGARLGVTRFDKQGAAFAYAFIPESAALENEKQFERLAPTWGDLATSAEELTAGKQAVAKVVLRPPGPVAIGAPVRAVDGRGWPVVSLWCRRTIQMHGAYPNGSLVFGMMEIANECAVPTGLPKYNSFGGYGRVIPLRLAWPGFAINTIFYAAIVWMLFAVPGAIRRLRGGVRRKRGQCAACGYSLRENASDKCPECGQMKRLHKGVIV